jgi:hypothetical protein
VTAVVILLTRTGGVSQKLIELLFDTNIMRSEMMEMQIDLDKMPLGALSRKQIESAYVPPHNRLFSS